MVAAAGGLNFNTIPPIFGNTGAIATKATNRKRK
jgi:hypothetical protein